MRFPYLLAVALTLALAPARADDLPTPKAPGKQLPGAELELVFAYGSEKQGWIDETTRAYNESAPKLSDGRTTIRVKTLPMGSGAIIDRLLKPTGDADRVEAHVVSPASSAFVMIGNGEALERDGSEIIGDIQNLVSSPLVLALQSDLADATGWRANPPSWREVFESVGDPEKWKAAVQKGAGNLPRLRLGHTDPEQSNSGLLTLILMVESSLGSPEAYKGAFTRADVRSPEVVEWLHKIKGGVVYPLSSSTGFLAKEMTGNKASGMNAALVYESLVIENNRREGSAKLIAIYPKEGVFANEHPIGIVQRPWVGSGQKEAAKHYIAFLRSRDQQVKAKVHGFRPSDSSIPIDDLLQPDLGVSPAELNSLPSPNSQLIKEVRAVWRADSKPTAPAAEGVR